VLWIVAGFGVNIRRPDNEVPEEIEDRIVFLEDIVQGSSRHHLAEAIVAGLKKRLVFLGDDSWNRAVDEWTRSASWNRPYIHLDGPSKICGIPIRLAADGGLILMTDKGEVTVYSGEIIETVQSPEDRVQREDL
jgi:biotin-(acetyl-CoA carboxylase) ligase